MDLDLTPPEPAASEELARLDGQIKGREAACAALSDAGLHDEAEAQRRALDELRARRPSLLPPSVRLRRARVRAARAHKASEKAEQAVRAAEEALEAATAALADARCAYAGKLALEANAAREVDEAEAAAAVAEAAEEPRVIDLSEHLGGDLTGGAGGNPDDPHAGYAAALLSVRLVLSRAMEDGADERVKAAAEQGRRRRLGPTQVKVPFARGGPL